MKNRQHGKIISFDDCQRQFTLSREGYLHSFRIVEMLTENMALMLSTRDVKAPSLAGYRIFSEENKDVFLRAHLSDGVLVEEGAEYFCSYDVMVDDIAHLRIYSAVEEKKWVADKPVMKMLASWRMKFLGRTGANKLYKAYGEQSFMMIKHKPDEVSQLLQLNKYRMLVLQNEVNALHDNWHMLNFFLSKDFSIVESEMLVDVLKSKIKNESTNPFSILASRSISKDLQHRFFTAMGVYTRFKHDPEGVLSDLYDMRMKKTGETALLLSEAIEIGSQELRQDKAKIERIIHKMIKEGSANYRHIYGEDTISTGQMMQIDTLLAESFAVRMDEANAQNEDWVEKFDVCTSSDGSVFELNDDQKVAIQTAVSLPTSGITGGPGTGKSTSIKTLIHEIEKLSPTGRIFLAAPTGKAARRMKDLTGKPCMTLHKMLGMSPDSSPVLASFSENDTLILDECSLMDVYLLAAAIKHTGSRGRVVLIGDPDQLDSIDTGSALNDLILSRHITIAVLSEVQRQSKKSNIVNGSYAIRNGQLPDFSAPSSDLHLIEANSPSEVSHQIERLVKDVIPKKFGFNLNEIQVLAAMRKGEAGINRLNELLKLHLNPHSKDSNTLSRALGNQIYHIGDRVMQLKNRYDLDIQNGEVGEIIDFDEAKCKVILKTDDRTIALPYDNYQFMTHAWSISIHKSQGSEYPCVIISLPEDHQFMLNRKSLYTAITRGKNQVFIVGSKRTLELAINDGKMNTGEALPNFANKKRLTHLPFLLSEQICLRSKHPALQKMARDSLLVSPPEPVHKTRAESIIVPF